MKRTVTFILALLMILSLSVTGFAAGEPVTFSLTTDKTTVEVGDVITVSFSISTDSEKVLTVTDGEVRWDETVFEPVGSPVVETVYSGGYSANLTQITTGQKTIKLGTDQDFTHTATPSKIFTFQLKVIGGADGKGKIYNCNSQAFISGQTASLAVNADDLELTITRSSSDVLVTGVSVSPTSKTLTTEGETFTVAATVAPNNATNKGVRFTSDNTAVATVNETTGEVTAVSSGTANIIATTLDGNFTASCTVTVNIKPMYTLTYISNGGTYYAPEQHPEGQKVLLDKVPTRSGYNFTGWYLESACTTLASEVTVAKNMEVYAGWTANNSDSGLPGPGGPVDTSCKRDKNCPAYKFDDLNLNLWYHDGIHFCVEENLMRGTGETTFSPSMTTSRGMVVTMLYRLEGEPEVSGENPFKDVLPGSYYEQAIIWAADNGVVEGYGNNLFGPDDAITREQMAAIMWRYADYSGCDMDVNADLSAYTDAEKISGWALTAMKWVNAHGIIEGISRTQLDPTGAATRDQAANIFQRYCENIIK